MPGLYISSAVLPLECQFINILEMHCGVNYSLQNLVVRLIQEIDEMGFKQWSQTVYKISLFSNDFIKVQRGDQIINTKNTNMLQKHINTSFDKTSHFFNQISQQNLKQQQQQQKVKQEEIQKNNFLLKNQQNFDINNYQIKNEKQQIFQKQFEQFSKVQQHAQKNFLQKSRTLNEQKRILTRFGFLKSINSKKQCQEQKNVEQLQKNSSEKQKEYQNKDTQKTHSKTKNTRRNLKPMNKNANLPKFLIRIFTKYVDRYRGQYVKKQYDRLMSECRKMKDMKRNDRRQNAFGLKHLKIFFKNNTQGYPDPKLNRRVISKIICNNLLTEISHSQIPQSHRVGYLIACKIYSIRCRNVNLASRIQTK